MICRERILIKFITLILSLHVGILPVEVAVTGPLAKLEMHLDGQMVGERTSPPWTFDVDLGHNLIPHRLEAIAFDDQGQEIERASQWVNYARQSLEASLVLESSGMTQPTRGRVIWSAADNSQPIKIELRYDGRPHEVASDGRFVLPGSEPSETHHLEAKLLFPDEHIAHTEAVFGGTRGDAVTTALTAIPMSLEEDHQPDLDQLSQWLEVAGQPATVFSTDPISSDGATSQAKNNSIIIVRDTHIDRDLRLLLREKRQRVLAKTGRFLGPDDRVEFLLTYNLLQDPRGVHRPFPVSSDFNKLGMWNLFTQDYPQINQPKQQNIWWSLALAGKRVVDLKQPRVAVLLLSKKPQSRPALSFEQAQLYLRSLRVPLLVWLPEEATLERLGIAPDRPYIGADGMLQMFADIQAVLDQQRMVWIEGDYLPTEVTLSAKAPGGVRLVQ